MRPRPLKRFELDDSLGGVGETAKCNSWQSWHEASCEIIPGKQSSDKIIVQCNRYRAQFVRECIQKRVRRTHSPTGIAGKYEGIEISWIDVEHVFDQKCNGAKNISGGHWDRKGLLKKAGVLEVEDIEKGIDGCYKGNAKLLNRSFYDGKSYFGDDWTAEQIAQALCEALENITSVELEKGALHKMYGRTKMGLEIEMMARYKNGKIYVNSFYPKIN